MNDPLLIVGAVVAIIQVPVVVFLFKHVWDKVMAQELRQNQMDRILAVLDTKLIQETSDLDKIDVKLEELLNVTSRYNSERKPK
jgi:hypothetical protein